MEFPRGNGLRLKYQKSLNLLWFDHTLKKEKFTQVLFQRHSGRCGLSSCSCFREKSVFSVLQWKLDGVGVTNVIIWH